MYTRPLLALLLASACSRTADIKPFMLEEPPRLIVSADGKTRLWNNAQAFLPVPLQLRAKALEACEGIGLTPAGYHPRAQDDTGKPFAGGGFYCTQSQ